jgi:hypothetical protein
MPEEALRSQRDGDGRLRIPVAETADRRSPGVTGIVERRGWSRPCQRTADLMRCPEGRGSSQDEGRAPGAHSAPAADSRTWPPLDYMRSSAHDS